MKDIAVKVNKVEAQVLIDLCEKNGYELANVDKEWKDRHYWFFVDSKKKEYHFWGEGATIVCTELYFYEDMAKIKALFKPEFKVGDWVYFHGEGDRRLITNAWKVGRVCKITGISADWIDRFYGGGGSNNLCNVRHATPEEIAKVKGKDIMIGEHKVEFLDDGIKVGCETFDRPQIINMWIIAKIVKRHKSGASLTVNGETMVFSKDHLTFEGVTCPYKTLKKIYKKLKS